MKERRQRWQEMSERVMQHLVDMLKGVMLVLNSPVDWVTLMDEVQLFERSLARLEPMNNHRYSKSLLRQV